MIERRLWSHVLIEIQNWRCRENLINLISWRLQRSKIKEIIRWSASLRTLSTVTWSMILLMQFHECLDNILNSSLLSLLKFLILLRRIRFINWSSEALNFLIWFGTFISLIWSGRLLEISILRNWSYISSLRFRFRSTSSLLFYSFENFISWFLVFLTL